MMVSSDLSRKDALLKDRGDRCFGGHTARTVMYDKLKRNDCLLQRATALELACAMLCFGQLACIEQQEAASAVGVLGLLRLTPLPQQCCMLITQTSSNWHPCMHTTPFLPIAKTQAVVATRAAKVETQNTACLREHSMARMDHTGFCMTGSNYARM